MKQKLKLNTQVCLTIKNQSLLMKTSNWFRLQVEDSSAHELGVYTWEQNSL